MARVKVGGAAVPVGGAPALFAEQSKDEGTKAPPVAAQAPADPEREAIQAESREAEIRLAQNAALSKVMARKKAELAKRVDETAVKTSSSAELDKVATAPFDPGTFFGNAHVPDVAPEPPSGLVAGENPFASAVRDLEDPVEATHGEEMYGKPGTFSSYRVGPFTSSTEVRPGETRTQALQRVLDELREVAAIERKKAHEEWTAHFLANIATKG